MRGVAWLMNQNFDIQRLKLLWNYITTRTQVTTIGNNTSEAKSEKCGTAQGSILGPLIYIIYVNDVLGLSGNDGNLYLYADDMLIMAHHKNVECMLNLLQSRMDKIYKWCRQKKSTVSSGAKHP